MFTPVSSSFLPFHELCRWLWHRPQRFGHWLHTASGLSLRSFYWEWVKVPFIRPPYLSEPLSSFLQIRFAIHQLQHVRVGEILFCIPDTDLWWHFRDLDWTTSGLLWQESVALSVRVRVCECVCVYVCVYQYFCACVRAYVSKLKRMFNKKVTYMSKIETLFIDVSSWL